MFVQKAITTSF